MVLNVEVLLAVPNTPDHTTLKERIFHMAMHAWKIIRSAARVNVVNRTSVVPPVAEIVVHRGRAAIDVVLRANEMAAMTNATCNPILSVSVLWVPM